MAEIRNGNGVHQVETTATQPQDVAVDFLKDVGLDRVNCECGISIYAPAYRHASGCTFRYTHSLAPRER